MRCRPATAGVGAAAVLDRSAGDGPRCAAGEGGSGAVLALALVAALATLLLLIAPLVQLSVLRASLSATADASALAAADVHRGLLSGDPCATARRLAATQGARLTRCEAEGESIRIELAVSWFGAEVTARSRAGAPGMCVSCR